MGKKDLIQYVEDNLVEKKEFPQFSPGDTITVRYKIREGNKERIQAFRGTVLQIKGDGINKNFTVRKVSGNIGIERIFPITSPVIESIKVNKRGSVRRSRIFFLRGRTGKSARIKEKRV